jgi:electron transfer flavoprotein-quinone oxidoreductase
LNREFDVLVVGAGPSGSACALHLARTGVNVLILEKGRVPGDKNVSGGIVYGSDVGGFGLKRLVPDFEATAPLERKISSHEVRILSSPDERRGSYRSRIWPSRPARHSRAGRPFWTSSRRMVPW